MSSAQLEILPLEEIGPEASVETTMDLRQQVAARLAAHRARRNQANQPAPSAEKRAGRERPANPIAATVAARYAQSPSYRAFLAEEARRAIEIADAAAEVAARNAEAVAAVQLQLLDELQSESREEIARPARKPRSQGLAPVVPIASVPEPVEQAPVQQVSTAGLTVRLYEDVGRPQVELRDNALVLPASPDDFEEAQALDEEIAFRQSPICEFVATEPPTPIPANLLAFPRQLVAAQKARPRLAEGPLRETIGAYDALQDTPAPQLRIFEVQATPPPPAPETTVVPEWTSIWLDTPTEQPLVVDGVAPVYEPAVVASPALELQPRIEIAFAPAVQVSVKPSAKSATAARSSHHIVQPAYMSHRLLAAATDAALVFGGALAAVTAFVLATGPATDLPQGRDAAIAATAAFVAFYVLYHLLFFTFSDATPGMRYARIGLCTFDDDNPTRSAMRRRMLATLVAVCPLGIGLLWAWLDDEGLGWHDRISRIYPRSY